ncbi:hypothetical protein quinque_010228 [Culex quinquefasciatus]
MADDFSGFQLLLDAANLILGDEKNEDESYRDSSFIRSKPLEHSTPNPAVRRGLQDVTNANWSTILNHFDESYYKVANDTSVSQRACRFSFESNLTHYGIYTKGICLQECRLKMAYQHCGCIPHFYPNNIPHPKPVCDYKTLRACFPKHEELFLEFRENAKSVNCFCEQNCVDSKVVIEKMQILTGTRKLLGSNGGLVIMKRYPLIRFNRQVLFTFTDLLVSIGGTAGFFLGFSVLGAVEIIYFFTLRLIWYILGRR